MDLTSNTRAAWRDWMLKEFPILDHDQFGEVIGAGISAAVLPIVARLAQLEASNKELIASNQQLTARVRELEEGPARPVLAIGSGSKRNG